MTDRPDQSLEQLQQDVERLQREVTRLKRDQAALCAFRAKARLRNIVAMSLATLVTIAGWALDASAWLRWYVLPLTLVLCALFSIGATVVSRHGKANITRLDQLLSEANIALNKSE